VPRDGDVVSITHSVLIDVPTARVKAIEVFGILVNVTQRLSVGTLIVYPQGALEMGTDEAPAVGAELVILDAPIDTIADPEQFGHGLIGLGKVTICGVEKTPFVRMTGELAAGVSALPIPSTDWQAGDAVFIPDTRQLANASGYVPQWEVLKYQQTPTLFAHKGARDDDGKLDCLPHVANLSRSVVIRSENPNGVRGHVLFSHGCDLDLCHVVFKDLGRTLAMVPGVAANVSHLNNTTFDAAGNVTKIGTNQIGRYPLHLHHLIGMPGHGGQFAVEGCVVDGGRKWGIAIHASHRGLVQGNIVHNIDGAGIVTEDGSEAENVIVGNFVCRVNAPGGNGAERQFQDLAWEGAGYHFRGGNNIVRDNVACNILNGYGFKLFQHSASKAIVSVPIREFLGNEMYGASEGGLTYWWIGTLSNVPIASMPESVIADTLIWNITHTDILHYPSNHLTLDGLVIRGDLKVNRETTAWMGGDYLAKDMLVRNADIQGRSNGIYPSTNSGPQVFADSFVRGKIAVTLRTLWTSGSDASEKTIPPRLVKLVNLTTRASLKQIERQYSTADGKNVVQKDALELQNFNGITGKGHWSQQVASYVVPPSRKRANGRDYAFVGSPEGTMVAGELSPCVATLAGIDGLVCQ
jgi:hypothetical protein